MSGTRLNSKIEDLGASITVVTKQQMQDFALLDINDLFNYEAGTEGTGNYTSITFGRDGNNIDDNVEKNPQGANRIRGVGPANITFGNFAGRGRVPIDPINIDAVEISRGPRVPGFRRARRHQLLDDQPRDEHDESCHRQSEHDPDVVVALAGARHAARVVSRVE